MNKTIICIAFLVLLSNAVKFEQVSSQLKQIESSKFGKNILDMIQIQLSSNDGVDQLIHELENLQQDLVNEQNVDDQTNSRLQEECSNDQNRLNSEIEEARQKSAELQSEIDAKVPVRDQKNVQLSENESLKTQYEQEILSVQASVEQLDAQWAQTQDDHDKATHVIQRAKEVLVGEFQRGSSFLQNKKNINFAQISKSFNDGAKNQNFQKKSWNKLFKVLSQITSAAPIQADAGALAKIVELCDDLLAKLAESLLQERQQYNHQSSQYKDQIHNLQEHLSDTKLRIDNLQAEIHALNTRIEQCRNDRDYQDQRIVEKSSELEKRTQYCRDQQDQYERRSQERSEQLDIVRQVLDIINSQLRVLKKYVGERDE